MYKSFRVFSLISVLSCLQACVPAFVAGAAVGGAVVYDRRTLDVLQDDQSMAYQIENDVYTNPTVFKGSHIVATSFNRVVLLVGETTSEAAKAEAQRVAESMEGVKRVFNQITLEPPISMTQRAQDTWITTTLRTKMLTSAGLKSGQIKVLTEAGTVYLLGIVTREQSDLATQVAREIKGVRQVVKLFQVINIDA